MSQRFPRLELLTLAFPTLFLLLIVTALSNVHGEPASAPIRLDQHRTLGPPIQVDNLTVWPVSSDAPVATGELLSLAEAESRGLARVFEKGVGEAGDPSQQRAVADQAEVNQLMIENRGKIPILVFAGTIVKGGKQDRQLGQDLVIAAGATVPVDAFCVEQGRWSTVREGKATEGVFTVEKMVASKRVRSAGQYGKDQSGVWDQVAKVNAKAAKDPTTSTFLATVEEDDSQARALRARFETEVRQRFAELAAAGKVVGFAYAVNGEPLGMRTFANSQLLDAHLATFVKTMSLEAQVAQQRDRAAGKPIFDRPASEAGLLRLLQGIAEAPLEEHSSPALNKNRSRANGWGGHSVCLIPASEPGQEPWIPVTEDWTTATEVEGEVREVLMRLQALGYTSQ